MGGKQQSRCSVNGLVIPSHCHLQGDAARANKNKSSAICHLTTQCIADTYLRPAGWQVQEWVALQKLDRSHDAVLSQELHQLCSLCILAHHAPHVSSQPAVCFALQPSIMSAFRKHQVNTKCCVVSAFYAQM